MRGRATMPERPLSPNRLRATRLLSAGAAGGHAAALVVVPLMLLIRGPSGGLSALVAGLGVLAFMGLGQAVQVWLADSDPTWVLVGSLGSYAFRVGLPLTALVMLGTSPERLTGVDRTAVAVTAITIVLAWLGAEMWAFSRLRIPAFDQPQEQTETQNQGWPDKD